MVAASLALVYACDQQASDTAGISVGSSVDVARAGGDASAETHDPTDGGASPADDADALPAEPGLATVPDPTAVDSAPIVAPVDGTVPTTRPPTPPSTEPPTAIDLVPDRITVPATSAPTVDGCGDPVSFGGRQMIDGVDHTTWRMDGDGTGVTVVIELDGARRVLSVGLIPGFDAVDPCDGTDQFATNRRVTTVTWEFDSGKRVAQKLLNVATLQRIDVDATTTRIKLHIDGVSADPAADFTAVSELVVRGV